MYCVLVAIVYVYLVVKCSFAVFWPMVWNSLPLHLQHILTHETKYCTLKHILSNILHRLTFLHVCVHVIVWCKMSSDNQVQYKNDYDSDFQVCVTVKKEIRFWEWFIQKHAWSLRMIQIVADQFQHFNRCNTNVKKCFRTHGYWTLVFLSANTWSKLFNCNAWFYFFHFLIIDIFFLPAKWISYIKHYKLQRTYLIQNSQ